MVAYDGGTLGGSRLVLGLVEEDGDWKLDRKVAFVEFDRDGFDRAYRRSLLEFGTPRDGVECALAKSRRLSDSELRHGILGGDHVDDFARIVVECDREGVERGLVETVGSPEFGFPARIARCAAVRLRASSDAELARIVLDVPAYGRTILGCDPDAIVDFQRRELSSAGELDPATIACVVDAFRRMPTGEAIRLSYDGNRYQALIDRC